MSFFDILRQAYLAEMLAEEMGSKRQRSCEHCPFQHKDTSWDDWSLSYEKQKAMLINLYQSWPMPTDEEKEEMCLKPEWLFVEWNQDDTNPWEADFDGNVVQQLVGKATMARNRIFYEDELWDANDYPNEKLTWQSLQKLAINSLATACLCVMAGPPEDEMYADDYYEAAMKFCCDLLEAKDLPDENRLEIVRDLGLEIHLTLGFVQADVKKMSPCPTFMNRLNQVLLVKENLQRVKSFAPLRLGEIFFIIS